MIEQTLIVIKPDGVKRGLIGEIITRFEKRGFKIKALKMLNFSKEMAEEFYSPHKGKAFFNELIAFITSGPVVAMILEGNYALSVVRSMIGSTKSYEALSGTIRGDYGLGITDNVIHASDSKESFEREAKIIF
ncbi:MAG: nucleoside-diphosphate kinase [Nitrososphaerales archaeon]